MADDNYSRSSRANYPFARGNPPADPGGRAAGNDPLSELARLIGQNDPFADTARVPPRDARNDWSDRQAAPGGDGTGLPEHHDPYAPRTGGYGRSAPDYHQEQQPAERGYDAYAPAADGASLQPDSGYPAPAYAPGNAYGAPPTGPYYGDDGQLSPHDSYASEPYRYEEPRRRRGGLMTVVAVIGLAVIGTAGAYAYRTMFSGSAPAFPPLIKADATPNKIVPAANGDGAANKQFNDRLVGERTQGEKMLPREEQPVDLKVTMPRTPTNPATIQGGAPAAIAGSQPPGPTGAWPATAPSTPPASTAPPGEPRKIRTVTIRSEQGMGLSTTSSPPQVPNAPASLAPTPERAPPPPRAEASAASAQATHAQPKRSAAPPPSHQPVDTATSGSGPLMLTPAGGIEEQPRATSIAPPQRTAALSPRSTGGDGSYVVQVTAQKSESEATEAFRSIQARHPALLGGQRLLLRRKEIAGKGTFYGAQVGPFASREDAVELCERLKSAGGACMVQRN